MTERFVLLDDREAPDAGSGYAEWEGKIPPRGAGAARAAPLGARHPGRRDGDDDALDSG